LTFQPNRKFKRGYDRLFKKDPLGANTFLLLCELADEKGQMRIGEQELADLMAARFNDPERYAI
jgi:hypothetical protein